MPVPAARSPHRPLLAGLLATALLGVALYFYWHYYERPVATGEPEPAPVDTLPATATDADAPVAAPSNSEPLSPQAKLLDRARQRMDDGALLEPAGDNARQYIDAAHKLAPDDPQVRAAALKLGDLIIAAARRAIASGNSDDARHWLSAAADYQINPATLDWLRQQVDALDPPAATAPVAPPAATIAPPAAAPAAAAVAEPN